MDAKPNPLRQSGASNGSSSSSVKRSFDAIDEDVGALSVLQGVLRYIEDECPASSDKAALLRVCRESSEKVLDHSVFDLDLGDKHYTELKAMELGCYLSRLSHLTTVELSTAFSRCILMAFDCCEENAEEDSGMSFSQS